MRKSGSTLGYAVFLLAMILAILWIVRWYPFREEMRDRRRPSSEELQLEPHVDLELMKLLGHIRVDKLSSFVNFPLTSPRGSRRVCAFGDSYTYGHEVGRDLDYPSQLQRLLARDGYEHVEILNFGSPSHGFHQAYMMWEAQAERFGCDTILLGPLCFQPKRDTRFNHSDLEQPYYLHSRFILETGGVRRIDVAGATHAERLNDYFRFFPRWRYLRYERSAPPVLLSFIGQGRTLDNPFYYRADSRDEEAHATYEVLLRDLAERSEQVALLHDHSDIVMLAQRLDVENLVASRIHRETGFPYRAWRGHNSGIGNALVADQYLAALTAGASAALTVLRSSDSPLPLPGVRTNKRDLSSFDWIEVRIRDRPMGFLVSPLLGTSRSDLRGTQVDALLAVKNPETSLVDAFFIPLEHDIYEGDAVVAKVRSKAGEASYQLGRVRLLDPRLNLGVIELEGIEFRRRLMGNRLYFRGNETLPWEQLATATKVEIRVDDQDILKGRIRGERVRFKLESDEFGEYGFYELRAGRNHYLEVGDLSDSGPFELHLGHPKDGEFRVPIGRWNRETVEVPIAKLPTLLRPSRQSPRSVER